MRVSCVALLTCGVVQHTISFYTVNEILAAVNTHRPLQVAFATTSSTIKDRRTWGLPPGRSETADAMGSPPDD